uniref:Ig-like domain-containing protein n=1 Tax=Anopheles melas TaxID=34690 RepID=A0A182UDI6_9DIPT
MLPDTREMEARAEIVGPQVKYLTPDSTLKLICRVVQSTEASAFIFWYHNNRMINYDLDRGINVSTEADWWLVVPANILSHHFFASFNGRMAPALSEVGIPPPETIRPSPSGDEIWPAFAHECGQVCWWWFVPLVMVFVTNASCTIGHQTRKCTRHDKG